MQDHLFPVKGVEDAFAEMHQVWDRLGNGKNLQTELWHIPHSCGVDVQNRILEFLNENL